MLDTVSTDNAKAWSQKGAAFAYRHASALFPAERAQLQALANEIPNAALLDIGIGTGRTTGHLAPRCAAYTGIDYSAKMIARARDRFPGLALEVMDARDMRAFATGQFDVVVFSYNGIDYVSHADRIQILAEIARVLRPGGAFLFSAHRLGTAIPAASDLSNLKLGWNPARLLRGVVRYMEGIWHARRMKPREVRTATHALLNDPAQQYRLLTYYISPLEQWHQLRAQGFDNVRAFTENGATIAFDAPYPTDCADDYMVHYLARRA